MKFIPNYDKDFYPMSVKLQEFRAEVKNSKSKKLSICVERNILSTFLTIVLRLNKTIL